MLIYFIHRHQIALYVMKNEDEESNQNISCFVQNDIIKAQFVNMFSV